MNKIVTIVGARPNFIKLAPLSKKLRKSFNEVIIHTGQHYDYEMSKLFFDEFDIPEPDYNLGIKGTDPCDQISQMVKEMSKVLIKERPDMTICIGDTNSTVAGALASVHNNIPVAHIEAGPRNIYLNNPEMINRILTDRCSSLLFCCTKYNETTLINEGMGKNAYFTGDLLYELYLNVLDRIKLSIIEFGLKPFEYDLITLHRYENVDFKSKLETIFNSLVESGRSFVFPIHPRTKKNLKNFGLYDKIKNYENIKIIPPQSYIKLMTLGYFCNKIITDSGGLQREAYFLKKPCIVLFNHAIWREIKEINWSINVGIYKEQILDAIFNFTPPKEHPNLFGDGNTSDIIMDILSSYNLSNAFLL